MNNIQSKIDGSRPTLIMFYATWCPHCHRMMPIVDDLAVLFDGRANIVKLDGEQYPQEMKTCGIDAFPGWALFKDGQEVWHDEGEKPASELEDMVNRFV